VQALLLQHDGLWDAGSADAPQRPARRFDGFDAWCETQRGAHCELLLSGTVVHDLVCEPGLPLASDAQLLQHAQAVFKHYHGDGAMAWRLAGWNSGSRCGVSALHGADFAQLLHSAHRHGVVVRAMQPWWARALALVHRRLPSLRSTAAAWLLIVEGGFVKALSLHRGECVAVRAQWLDAGAGQGLQDFAAQLLDAGRTQAEVPVRLALGYGLAGGAAAGVELLGPIDGSAPSADWLIERKTRP
jgi:hypothetical protein